jgi:acetyltransferase-like isoleucine patch superfamily enzyme
MAGPHIPAELRRVLRDVVLNARICSPLGRLTAQPVVVGDGSWLGARSAVLPGVTIGPGCVVAAACVVTGDCAPHGPTPASRPAGSGT